MMVTTLKSTLKKDGLSNIQIGRKILIDKTVDTLGWYSKGVFIEPSSEITLGLSFTKFHLLDSINVKTLEDKSGNIWFASQEPWSIFINVQ